MKSMLLLKKVLTPPLVVVFVPFTDFFIINYLLGFSYKKSKSHYYYYFYLLTIHFAKTAKTSILYEIKMAKAVKDLLKMKLVFMLIWLLYLNFDT